MSHRALNPEQFKDIYHHTSPEAAESITKEGFRPGRTGDVFFSEKPHGYWGRAGSAAVHVRVPAEHAKWAGTTTSESGEKEELYTVPADKILHEHIQGFTEREEGG
jgi:RNA:NAD 2'-phosphotransferase (TPT1/KptA family)